MTKPENDKSVLRCVKGHPGMPTSPSINFTKRALTQKLWQIQRRTIPHFKAQITSVKKSHNPNLYANFFGRRIHPKSVKQTKRKGNFEFHYTLTQILWQIYLVLKLRLLPLRRAKIHSSVPTNLGRGLTKSRWNKLKVTAILSFSTWSRM